MLKVFDKVVSQAPYLYGSTSVAVTQKKYLSVLYVLLGVSFINFGLIILIQYLIAYITAWFLVWCYSFFNKNTFFNTRLWEIAICTYILFLPIHISIIENVICVFVLVILGAGILSVQGRYIINPVLLGLVTAFILNVSYQSSMTLPYLLPLLHKQYLLIGEKSLLQVFLDANLMILGFAEQTLLYKNSVLIYHSFIEQYNNSSSIINPLLYVSHTPYVGFSSLIVLWGVYLYLVITKIINALNPLLYILIFFIVYSLLTGTILPNLFLLQHPLLWGIAIILLNDKITQPNTKIGQYAFIIFTAVLSSVLFLKGRNEIDYIFAILIVSLFSSLIELITKAKPFAFHKEKHIPSVHTLVPAKVYLIKGILFSLMVLIVWLFSFLFSGDVLQKQESNYFQTQILKLFNYKIVQVTELDQNIFKIIDDNGKQGIVIYSKNFINRVHVELFILIQDQIIQDIQILKLQTAHSYQLNDIWKNQFIGLNISQLNDSLLEDNSLSTLQKTLYEAILKLKNYPIDILTNKKN